MRIECENCNAAYTIGDALLSDQPIGAQCPYCGHVRIVRRGDPPTLAKKPSLPTPAGGGSPLSMGLGSKPPPPPPMRGPAPSPFGGGLQGLQPTPRAQSNIDVSDLGAPSSGPFSDRFAPPVAPPPPPSSGGGPAAGGARCQVCSTELTDEFDKVIGLCETHQRERSGQPDFGSSTKAAETRSWRIRALDGSVQGPVTMAELKQGLEDNIYGEEDEFSRDNGDYQSMDKFHELRPYTKAERGGGGARTASAGQKRKDTSGNRPTTSKGGGLGAGTILLSLMVVGLAAGGAYVMMHPELMQGILSSFPASAKGDTGPVPVNPLKRQLDKWRLANPDASGTAEEHLASALQHMLEDTPLGHQQAQEALQRALLLDEDNAIAVAAYAENLVLWRGMMLSEEETSLVDAATRFAIATKPDAAGTQRGRAAYGVGIGDPNVTRNYAEKALALSPQDGMAKLYMASSYLAGNPPLAVKEAEAASDAMPNLRRADRLLARAYANAGRYASAMRRLDKRLSVEPNSLNTLWLKGDLERELGNTAAAKALYTRAINVDPDDVGPRVALGEMLLVMNDPRGATEAYRVVVESTRPVPPKYRQMALGGLARAELSFGRAPRVKEYAEAALKIDAHDPVALLAMADVSLNVGSATTATEYASQVLQIKPGEPAALVIQGRAALMSKRSEEGIAKIEEATQNDPRDIILRGVMSGAYLSLGGNLQAFTLMRRASEMDPTDPSSHGRRGLFALPDSAVKAALDRFKEAAKDLPDRSVALSSAAMVHYQLGEIAEARTLVAQSLEEDDANVGALLYAAQMALDRGNYKEAEDLARRMFRVERGSAIGWLTVGRAQMGQNKPKEAIESFETALRSQKGLLVAEVELAGARLKLGQVDDAKAALLSAYGRNPYLLRTRRLMLEAGE